jgi:hypothetical protein
MIVYMYMHMRLTLFTIHLSITRSYTSTAFRLVDPAPFPGLLSLFYVSCSVFSLSPPAPIIYPSKLTSVSVQTQTLQHILVFENPIEDPPMDEFQKGMESLQWYLRNRFLIEVVG